MKNTNKAVLMSVLTLVLGASFEASARDRDLLNRVLEETYQERKGVEQDYQANGAVARVQERNSEPRGIKLEIGDELNAQDAPSFRQADNSENYRERGINRKLEREWREVNKSFPSESRARR